MSAQSFEAGRTQLGFIGPGNMGSRIVRRLLSAGYSVQVYSRERHQAIAIEKAGAALAESVSALADCSDVILSCLTDDAAVHEIYAGPGGVLNNARPGALAIEMSTISPQVSREIAALGAEVGVHVLDVAISGSTPAAERGELILFGGGHPNLFEAARPIFQAFSKKAFHLGPSGAGTTMKLVVNAILGIEMQAIAEAAALGQSAGLDRHVLLEVLAQTAVIAPAHLGKLSRAAMEEFSPQFPLPLMHKDFRLILDLAKAAGASMPAAEAAYQINSAAMAAQEKEQDFSAVMKYMERLDQQLRRAGPGSRLTARASD